jgi:tripartite-type tricarboxylate transporter receptor subunit TctC
MPNVPTMSEAGVPGFEAEAWFMAAVPAGTPKAIVDRLNAEIAKALPAADVKEKLAGMGASAVGNKPEAATAFLRSEVDKWGRVIKTANIKLD